MNSRKLKLLFPIIGVIGVSGSSVENDNDVALAGAAVVKQWRNPGKSNADKP